MQRTTRPSGVPESPASSEKGCGGGRWGLSLIDLGRLFPTARKTPNPVTHHAPGPLVHNPDQPEIQLPYKFFHCLAQAAGHLHLTNALGHSADTFHSLQGEGRVKTPFLLQD